MKRPLGFLLASVLTGYPGEGFVGSIQTLLEEIDIDESCRIPDSQQWDRLKHLLVEYAQTPETAWKLSSDYIDTFDRGKLVNSLCETEYGKNRAFSKGHELSDIAGFYKAFGMDLSETDVTKESYDHISVELEFYALLLLKEMKLEEQANEEGITIVQDARKKFLTDHLGRFASAIAARPGVKEHPFYTETFQWCASLIENECQLMGVNPLPLEWRESSESSQNFTCGAGNKCAQ